MSLKQINGIVFKQMVINGANNLANRSKYVDQLNVFPVPDGDTGTNMSMTMTAGAKELVSLEEASIGKVAKVLSRGLLMGARGNSGVILSQLFRGFATGLEGKDEADIEDIAKALESGVKTAYKAVMKPIEGTILTVARESAEAAGAKYETVETIVDLYDLVVNEMQISLNRTPELLPVLKEVGVVDSGGAGLLLVLTGFMAALSGDRVDFVDIKSEGQVNAGTELESGEEGYGYCTEFIVRLEPSLIDKFSENQLKKELERIPGNSIVVVQDEDIVKVHVHTLKPGEALNLAQRFGEFVKLKIENMQEQANNLQNAAANQGSIVGVDDSKPQKREAKETAIISVCAGQGVEDAFLELHCDYVVSGGQTMNPSTEDMVAAVKEVNAKNVIILPNNSNIVMTAQQTATILEGEVNVIVIPTKTIPQGLSACVMYNPEVSLEDNIAEMEDAVANVKTGQVTFAIKDTNIDGVEIKANDYMALVEKDIVACKPNKLDALKVCLEKLVDEDSELITLLVGEDVVDEEVEEIESYIEDNFDAEVDIIEGKQPVYSFIIGVE